MQLFEKAPAPAPPKRYRREGGGLSFERVALFTDAVYAIAMTLIVVGIAMPALTDQDDAGSLWRALWDQRADIASFAIGVAVIGFFWTSHHHWFDDLAAVDDRYVAASVVYLATVAFLPYPIHLVGSFDQNPTAWTAFAVNLAAVSAMETVLLTHAQRAGLLRDEPSRAEARWARWMSMLPVPVFVGSIAVAFVAPWLTAITWLLAQPLQTLVSRRIKPGDHDE